MKKTTVMLAVAAAAIAGAAPATAVGGERCRAAKSTTMAATKTVRVYRQRQDLGIPVYACRRASGRRTFLGYHEPSDDFTSRIIAGIRISGDYVGFFRQITTRQAVTATGRVVNTRTRRTIRSVQRGRAAEETTEYATAGAVALTNRGTAAFSFFLSSPGGTNRRSQVVVADGVGLTASRIVDEGPGVEARSLWLADPTTVTWLHDGNRRTATIG